MKNLTFAKKQKHKIISVFPTLSQQPSKHSPSSETTEPNAKQRRKHRRTNPKRNAIDDLANHLIPHPTQPPLKPKQPKKQ